jgi:hypothetical protein
VTCITPAEKMAAMLWPGPIVEQPVGEYQDSLIFRQ